MVNLLIIIFAMTLTYNAIANRFSSQIRILAIQGLLIFGVALIELHQINLINLIFILLETLVFKSILVPAILYAVITRNKVSRDCEINKSFFNSIFSVIAIFAFSFVLAYQLHDEHLKIIYFTASVSAILIGIFLMIFRKTIITHTIGYMVLENGIFLFSLALGSEMPMIVNMGILLDLFSTVLILGIFVNRISDVFHNIEVDVLTTLKD